MVLTGHHLEGGVGTDTNRLGGGVRNVLRKKLGGRKKLCTFIVIEV